MTTTDDPEFLAAWEQHSTDQDRRSMLGNLWAAALVQPTWGVLDYISQPDIWWMFMPGRLLLAAFCLSLLAVFPRLTTGWHIRVALVSGLWLSCAAVGPTVPGSGELYPLYVLGYSLLLGAGGAALGLSPGWSLALYGGMLALFPLSHVLVGTDQSATALLATAFFMITAAVLCGSATITRHRMRLGAFASAFALERRNKELAASRMETVEERAQHAAKDAFLARMSHELRTPINAILGYAELVREDVEEAGLGSTVADVARVEDAGRHLLDILGSILDLSAIEAGQVPLEPVDFALHELVHQTVDEVRHATRAKGLELFVQCEEVQTHQDPARLRQMLVALLSNAIRFSDTGSVRVDLQTHGPTIHLSVTDTGCGIPPEDLARVFAPFEQGDGSTTRRHDGSGLGLAVVRGLAQNLGGEVEVQSTVGVGSTFTLYLPQTLAE